MKQIQILLAVAAVAITGCRAQEGPQNALQPGLPPTAIPDVVTVQTNSTNNSIAALANDIDLSGTGLTITSVTVDQTLPPLAGATATTNGTTVTFTPPATFIGVVTLLYDIMDGDGGTSTGAIAVSVLPVALPPVAVPDVAVLTQDSGANDIDVLVNDVDLAAGGLTLTSATVTQSLPNVAHTIAVVGNEVRFTPAVAFVGVVLVDYVATDVNGETANGVLTIVVSPLAVPAGPVPVPDVVTVAQDSAAANHNVLANDVDPAGGGLTVTAVSITSSLPNVAQTVSINSNQVRFTPAAAFTGVVLISYTATDVNGDAADGVLTVVVSPLALALQPVTLPDSFVVDQDFGPVDINVLANDVDPAGGGLTLSNPVVFTSLPNAVHTVAVVGNQVRFTAAAGFAGVVVITYVATDVNGNDGNTGVLSIAVTPAALPVGPVPVPDAAVVMQDSGANDIDVLANDIDFVGGGLTLTGFTVTTSQPAAVHTVAIVADEIRFTPAAGFAGVVVITYTATDADGNDADGVLSITVSPLNPPVGLVAIPDAAVVAQDSGPTDVDVLANDVDVAGGGLTLSMVSVFSSQPAAVHTVAIVGNQVRFTPAAGFAGIVVVSYTATDANAATSNGLLSITVTPAALALPPLALPDVALASSGAGAQLFDVLVNDLDPAAGGLTLTNVSIVLPVPAAGVGTVALVGNQVQYTPTLITYVGVVLIEYTAEDINGNTTVGQLSLTVTL